LLLLVLDEIAVFADVRFGDVVVLQMRTAVESEYLGWRLAAFLQENANDIDCHRSDCQGAIDRLAQFMRWMTFQESQDLNELATSLTA
jgi:hypothetical protein